MPSQMKSPLTPQPSSDADMEDIFHRNGLAPKFIAPPTPSTSTVAHLSSPRCSIAFASSSSPTCKRFSPYPSKHSDTDVALTLEAGTTFIFGRHHVRKASKDIATTITSAVPHSLSYLVANHGNNVETIILPRSAHHASRVHALVELILPASQTRAKVMRILAIGQNGMRVKLQGTRLQLKKKGIRLVPGQKIDVEVEDGCAVNLDFYGAKAVIFMDGKTRNAASLTSFSVPEQPITAGSMPPSSPPMLPALLIDDGNEDDLPIAEFSSANPQKIENEHEQKDEEPIEKLFKAHSRESSPLSLVSNCSAPSSPVLSVSNPSRAYSPELCLPILASSSIYVDDIQVKSELIEQESCPKLQKEQPKSSLSPPTSANQIKPCHVDVDRAAVMATTVVFSGSSKLSLPNLVKHMLDAYPHLKDHGDEAQWAKWADEELETNPMFGKVERHGKDSSGHPLLPHYFYDPSSDLDPQRAKDLGGLVRPLRTAARGGQAIDWRPVGRKRKVPGW
ncbi:hypothetical protein L204_105972 [Cryptococcus depauperatus]|nr:hypothetical protein L204_05094 [Cryptococcus depauperatus CBS 7855]